MHIYSKIVETEREVVNLVLPDDYDFESPVKERVIAEENEASAFNTRIIYTSGLCIRESSYRIFRNIKTYFDNDGEHIDFFFYLKGKSRIDNIHLPYLYDEEIGIGRRSYIGSNGQRGFVEFKQNNHIRFIMIAMSRTFFKNLLQNEPWLKDDSFSQDVLAGNFNEKYDDNFSITHPMLNILQYLLHGDHIKKNKRHFLELKLRELLLTIHEHQMFSTDRLQIGDNVRKNLESVRAYLIQNYNKPPTIARLARLFLINEKSLKKHFKALYGITIHAYIIKVRMEKAHEMILKNCTVSETANATGYHSVSHFIKMFKSHYGRTPKEIMVNFAKVNLINLLYLFSI